MLWTLFECGINLLQAVMMILFMHKRLPNKPAAKYGACAFIALITGCFCLYTFIDISVIDTWIFLLPLLYSLLFQYGKWYVKVFWSILLTVVVLGITNFMTGVFLTPTGMSYEILMSNGNARLLFVVSVNVTIAFSLYLISLIRPKNTPLSTIAAVVLCVQIALTLLVVEMLFQIVTNIEGYDTTLTVVSFAIMAFSMLSLVLYELMTRNAKKEQDLQYRIGQMESNLKYQEETQILYERMRSLRHDLNNHVAVLQELLNANNTEEGQKYIGQIRREFAYHYNTGCIAMDALLTSKALLAQKHGVQTQFSICPMRTLPLEEAQFCALLGNLLDNALEACERKKESGDNGEELYIHLRLNRAMDMLYIQCENPVDPAGVKVKGDEFLSSKGGERHGLGIRSIRETAANAGGYSSFTVDHDKAVFLAKVSIPLHEAQEEEPESRNKSA